LKDQKEWFKIVALHPVTEASKNIASKIKELAK
jgi:hypothetical protein